LIDFDGPSALNLNGIELLVLHNEILTLRDFIPARHVLPRDYLTAFRIHVLLLRFNKATVADLARWARALRIIADEMEAEAQAQCDGDFETMFP